MKHIHIRNEQVEDLLCYKWLSVAEAIESAFVDETADMIPKTYLDGWGGDFRVMPAALGDYTAVKWVSVFPDNWKKEKHEFLSKLRKINDILLVFELGEEKNSERFIIYDKKN